MSKKILNSIGGMGVNIKERAAVLTIKQYREHRQVNRVSWAIKTDFSKCKDVQPRGKRRTKLWP